MKQFINLRIIILMMLFYSYRIGAQIPSSDPTWTLQLEDQFDSLKVSKWWNTYNWGPTNFGLEYMDPNNLLFNSPSGYLTIKAEKLTTPIIYNSTPYFYKSGVIHSKFQYKYGYYEISAKCPTKALGYWHGFWVFDQGGPPGIGACYSVGWHNEIDILERNGSTSRFDEIGGGHVWAHPDTCSINNRLYPKGLAFQNLSVTGDITQEHKYGMFWEPDRMTWYYDDMPVRIIYDTVYTPQNQLRTILNFGIDPSWAPDPSTPFPAYYSINYLKIWQLIPDCNTVETFCSTAFNAGTYVSKVKKSISLGGSGCSSPSTINTSSNIGLWATDFVLIDEGTTINDNGSGNFSAQVTKCPN